MKEQFRNWQPNSTININYKNGSGSTVWTYQQEGLLRKIISITEAYRQQHIILTSRQLYYQLVAQGIIPNAIEIYKRMTKFLTDARYGGHVDWEAIEDRGRVPEKHSEWENVESLIESAVQAYRLPRWKDQDEYIELYCEKQALESVFKPIANKWHIYFGYNKGYSSASTMYDLAKRVKEQIDIDKAVTILYFGDHDPSGLDMVRDIEARIKEFLTKGEEDPIDEERVELFFHVQQVALNIDQVNKYNPPPNPAKITDPRAKKYITTWGEKSWELDALNPTILRDLTQQAILEHIDVTKYDAVVQQEKEEIYSLQKFGKTLNRRQAV